MQFIAQWLSVKKIEKKKNITQEEHAETKQPAQVSSRKAV
jgi:hypothetical protein